MSPPPGVELSRAELLWVVEQCGGDAWPYPLRRPHWPADTDRETARHRAHAEEGLRGRGLLAPAPAAFLLAVGEIVRDWSVAVDLVRRTARADPGGPVDRTDHADRTDRTGPAADRVVVAVSDGCRAAVLASPDHDVAAVRVRPARPDRLPEAVLGLLGPSRPGTGPAVGVSADVLAGAPAAHPAGATRRSVEARRHVRRLVDTASDWALAGVAARSPNGPDGRPGAPARRAPLVMWLDGPHGTYRVVHDPRGETARALVAPTDQAELAADLHRVVGGVPPPRGRRTT